jgi:nucleotide-binding universal stress UspA family protein
MFQTVLLAVALQDWETPTPYALAAREVAIQLAKGASHPLQVLTVYRYHIPPLVQPPLVGPEAMPVSERIVSTEEETIREAVTAKLHTYVAAIENAGVSVVRLVRSGTPREAVLRVAAEVRADCLVIGSHSKRHVFDLGGTAQAICRRASAVVVMASPGQ